MIRPSYRWLKVASLTAASGVVIALSASAQNVPNVGGQPMLPRRNIVENAVNSADHTTLVAAVQAADLVETLQSPGPFTVFAPTNAAFGKLPEGTVETLLQPENLETLQTVLTYHVVPGSLDRLQLLTRIQSGGGSATLETASGGTLTASLNGPNNIVLTDAAGNVAEISTYNVFQSNGVIHVITSVLLPQ